MTVRMEATLRTAGADTYYRQKVETYPGASVSTDAGGRARVSQLATLFDGKTLNAEDALLWHTAGTGSAAYAEAANTLSVTAGQYLVRQSRQFLPYFSGKPQVAEITFDGFANQAGVVKRFGYYSSSAVAPYTAAFDGWYIEADGSTYRLVVSRGGVKVLDLPWTQWTNYAAISGYNWNNFTVVLVDFLWLGGAVLRLFIKDPAGGFVLAHTFDYAGSAAGTFMLNPNQPVRYEIRSTSGAGSLRAICSQVATEGSISESGESIGLYNDALVSANTVGNTYALLGVKKQAAYRDAPVRIHSVGAAISTSDAGVLLLLRNPTLSAALTYTNSGRIQQGVASAGQTVTANGRVVHAVPVVGSAVSDPLIHNSMAWLSSGVDNTLDEYVLAYRVLTTNQTLVGTINLVEY